MNLTQIEKLYVTALEKQLQIGIGLKNLDKFNAQAGTRRRYRERMDKQNKIVCSLKERIEGGERI